MKSPDSPYQPPKLPSKVTLLSLLSLPSKICHLVTHQYLLSYFIVSKHTQHVQMYCVCKYKGTDTKQTRLM